MEIETFTYQPTCSVKGCDEPAHFKVAAPWSDGTSRELKNYGQTCDEHREKQLERAYHARKALKLTEGETVGEVGLYEIIPGMRDVDLPRLSD